jgi:hypothetical protein
MFLQHSANCSFLDVQLFCTKHCSAWLSMNWSKECSFMKLFDIWRYTWVKRGFFIWSGILFMQKRSLDTLSAFLIISSKALPIEAFQWRLHCQIRGTALRWSFVSECEFDLHLKASERQWPLRCLIQITVGTRRWWIVCWAEATMPIGISHYRQNSPILAQRTHRENSERDEKRQNV